MMTSLTRAPSTPARSIAALIAVLPSSWAGRFANAPLNAPTGVRVALTMTMSSFIRSSCCVEFWGGQRFLALPHPQQATSVCQHDWPVEYPRQLALFGVFARDASRRLVLPRCHKTAGPYERKLSMLKPWAGETCDPHGRGKKRAGYNQKVREPAAL